VKEAPGLVHLVSVFQFQDINVGLSLWKHMKFKDYIT
jgi:hypothetical protein